MYENKTIEQNENLKIEIELKDNQVHFKIIGQINEDANLGDLISFLKESRPEPINKIVFDMNHLTSVNSCGVREWILFIENIQGKFPLEFENINDIFIDQASMVSSMFGNKKPTVTTFYIPYFCSKCSSRFLKLSAKEFVINSEYKIEVPKTKCPNCNIEAEFDSIEEDYFSFFKFTG